MLWIPIIANVRVTPLGCRLEIVSLLGYQMGDKEPGYSFSMQGIYHLGTVTERKGGCIVSPRRQKDAPFTADDRSIKDDLRFDGTRNPYLPIFSLR
jgi:hypothetical protein